MYHSESDNCLRCRRPETNLLSDYCEKCYEVMARLWYHQSSRTVEDLEFICMNGMCEICGT